MNFAGIGPAELLLILIIALLVFGPRRLPEIARDLGKNIGKWRQALEEIQGITDVTGTKPSPSASKEAEMQRSVQQVVKRKEKDEAVADQMGAAEEKEEEAEGQT